MSEYNPREVFEKKIGLNSFQLFDKSKDEIIYYFEMYSKHLEEQKKQMLEFLKNEYNISIYPPIEKGREHRFKRIIESITGKSIEEAIKE